MSRSQPLQLLGSPRRRRGVNIATGIGVVALALAVPLTAIALATGGPISLSSTSNSGLGEQITVDAHGRTLYALSPETTHHLLCKSSECMKFWPPFTVRSSKTKLTGTSGVHGHLAIFRRSNGVLQVTLGGLPLYHYSGDHAAAEANGQGIHSFGGAWHVISVTSNVSPAPATPTPPASPMPAAPMPASPPPSYPY
jgi:predicted lipoprotein with Yx(FWY)xxD motif